MTSCFGEAGVEQALRHGVRGHRGAAHRIGGVDLNELLKNIAGELFGLLVQLGQGGKCCGGEQHTEDQEAEPSSSADNQGHRIPLMSKVKHAR